MERGDGTEKREDTRIGDGELGSTGWRETWGTCSTASRREVDAPGRDFDLPCKNPAGAHGNFRRVPMIQDSKNGIILILGRHGTESRSVEYNY